MPRSLRPSTLKERETRKNREREKNSLELKVKEKNKKRLFPRKIEKHKKNSQKLHEVIEENQEALNKEIERLKSLAQADIDEESESSETGEFESPRSQIGSEKSLTWDNEGDLSSPLKDTSDLLDTTF